MPSKAENIEHIIKERCEISGPFKIWHFHINHTMQMFKIDENTGCAVDIGVTVGRFMIIQNFLNM
jgi:hypothetical protein